MTAGTFTFYSWLRRGLATLLQAPGGPTSQVSVKLNFATNAEEKSATAFLDVLGPGDIVGLDPAAIVRTWPRPDDLDAEFVSYPLIEFDQADLPWRYSPEPSTDTTTAVTPWFSLVVLKSSECALAPATAEQKLSVLTVTDLDALQNPSQLSAWGHSQFEGHGLDASGLLSRITGAPGQFTARLLSPRLLLPSTEYIACLVPSFERGRLVGLARIPADPNGPNASLNDTPALNLWNTADGPFQLPAYYSWRFRTGAIGDFEQAARLIKPFALPPTIGRRDLDVSDPGFRLPSASSGSLPVEGALLSIAAADPANTPTWPTTSHDAFVNALGTLVNSANVSTTDDPRVLPPLYGQWYAATSQLDHPQRSSDPKWFFELNSDPRNRVAAALGTNVIQREDQALLASGWGQVSEIREVNDTLRVLQLVRGSFGSLFARHFLTADTQRLYQLTTRLHGWVTCDDSTVCGHLKASSIVPGFLSPQWQRLTTRRGPIGRLQGRPDLVGFVPNLIDLLAQCKKPAPEPPDPVVHDPGDPRGSLPCDFIDDLSALPNSGSLFWGLAILWTVRDLLVSQNGDCWWLAVKALRYAISLLEIAGSPSDAHRRCRFFDRALTVQDLQNAPPMPSFTPFAKLPSVIPLPAIPGPPGVDNADAAAVRAALIHLLQTLVLNPVSLCPPHMDVEECGNQLKLELVPSLTVGVDFKQRLTAPVGWNPLDPLEPIFAAPSYERPMYEPLAAISSDWILPGLNGISRNAISLAVTNQRFVEAYMAGLNQEMTRELLWNEFPTDQRGTYFRQFWDIANSILEDGSTLPPDQLRDIFPLRLWDASKGLGAHSPRLPGGSGDTAALLVLVIRAELVRKYPNVVVYAQRRDPATNRLTGTQSRPVFQAHIDPDVAFYGFDLTIAEVKADADLFFVLQEHPGDPKFADEATVPTENRSDAVRYSAPGSLLGDTAGAIAESTFLRPFRIGFQAKSMLPPDAT